MFMSPYYHGSECTEIQALRKPKGNTLVFGSAIYLTTEVRVARCYSRYAGSIYEVSISGDMAHTINFDAPYYQQTPPVKKAIINVRRMLGLPVVFDSLANTRYIVHSDDIDKNLVNDELIKHGIWMLYGHVDGYEHSGTKDDGVQYAVLVDSNVSIIKKHCPVELLEQTT